MSDKHEEKSRESRDDLEYNDGLGDLLREKERFEFSWVKTLASVFVIILVLYLGVTILFKLAKSMVESSDVATQTSTPITNDPNQELVDEILATPSQTVTAPTPNSVETPLAPPLPAPGTATPKTEPTPQKPIATSRPRVDTAPVKVTESKEPKRVVVEEKKTVEPQAPVLYKKEIKKSSRKITVKVVTPEPQPAAADSSQSYKVIAGSFITRKNAEVLKSQLSTKKIEAYIWATTDNQKDTVYRVQVGSFKSKDVAQRLQSELNAKGVETYIQSN